MLIELRDVSFAYDGTGSGSLLLECLNLLVEKGDFIIIRGASGSGKSTILRLICRLLTPKSGTILFRGESLIAYPPAELRAKVGYVAQIPVVVEGSVAENLLLPFGFATNRTKRKPAAEELESMLGRFYLGDVQLSQPAQTLSVGQKQRLAIMRTLLQGPELLLLDEPTSALDRESAAMLFSIIERLNAEGLKTVIMVTHSDFSPKVPKVRAYLLSNRKLKAE
jgi:putative ABC transport system ATP-binding protein